MKDVTFKAGDFVYSIQAGWTTLKDSKNEYFPLESDTKSQLAYTFNGKFYDDDEHRSLLLPEEAKALGIEVPKKIVVKEGWINLYKNRDANSTLETGMAVHESEEIARRAASEKNYIGPKKISVEVEE